MAASTLPLLIYALLLVTALLLPFFIHKPQSSPLPDPNWLAILLVGGAIVLTLLRGELLVAGTVLLVVSSLGHGLRSLAGAVAASLLLAAATWWLNEVEISSTQQLIAAGTCLSLGLLVRSCRFELLAGGNTVPANPGLASRGEIVTLAGLLLAGLVAGLLTGATNATASATMAWHHWGAYLSPVLPMLAGGVPFRDFPVQYGMGPTLLLSAACGIGDCWRGLYVVTICANALYLATCGWSALLLTRTMDRGSRLLAIGALACAILLWAGYPVDWGGPIMTPSVGGLRFLPLAALTALILSAERPGRQESEAPLPCIIALTGHALWLLGLAWSPEAGFFATLLWWPWLALRRVDAAGSSTATLAVLLRGGVLGVAAVLAGYGALAIVFRLIFGDWVSLGDFLLYVSYPPGRLAVNALGAIWFAAALLLQAFLTLASTSNSSERRSLFACLLAALAAGSYYLSRSHDNNVLNLLPFLILLLLAAQRALPGELGSGFLRASLAGMIALTASIHFHAWTVLPGASSLGGLQIGPAALTNRFAPAPGPVPPLVAADAARALADLRRNTGEAVLLFDDKMVMPAADPAASWTGVNNGANFAPLPPEVIRHYVRQGAKQFARPGWLVVTNRDAGYLLGLFAAAYDASERRSYGSYIAYRLVPRNAR